MSLRSKLPGLALEAAMVVFAVLVALGVEEWRDEIQMRQFAERAEEAVLAEAQANLEEFRLTEEPISEMVASLAAALRESDVSSLGGSVGLELPDFSSAAWRAAQSSQASPYLDYDWVIQVSRAYETQELYSRMADQVLTAFSAIIGGGPTKESIGALVGPMAILDELHGQMIERLEALVDPAG